ncbi:hypothetical protein BD626DRAFT_564940 [Schizophyllum amplum]|uniref:Uncharacterized protein n=1 Tax=Schizophyllum amplum TaxID=97359 RepID=A0A550CTG4_9AGAR|nr:hypothetical protein BD626DRAFT_564940 [Auriculariopsis ampla]
MPSDVLLQYKGISDVLFALTLAIKPQYIYASLPVRIVAFVTGWPSFDANTAPAFNQALACMTATMGVGHIVASQQGPAARPAFYWMNITWAILSFLTCILPSSYDLGSAYLIVNSIAHALFAFLMYLSDF